MSAGAPSFKSKVLNLYSQDEQAHFRVEPQTDKVVLNYNQGAVQLPLELKNLTVENVNVHNKMFDNESKITTEKARAEAKEAVIDANVSAEEKRAGDEEARIEAKFDAEKVRVNAQEILEAQDLANEVLAREQADIALQTAITNEANTRAGADTAHTNAISAEQTRAEGEEKRIEDKHDAYVVSNDARVLIAENRHAGYVSSNDAKLDAHIVNFNTQATKQDTEHKQEVADRTADVLNLQNQINNILNGSPEHLDQLSEIVARFDANGATYDSRLNDLESVVQQLVEQLTN
jgi:hypothetical protein